MRQNPPLARPVFILPVLCALVGLVSSAPAGEGDAKVEIRKVALFKNGLGFIVSDAVLPENAATVRIGHLPIASFGTFWVGYQEGVGVQSLVTSMEDVEKENPVQSVGQLLLANPGRRVTLHTSDRDIEGTVMPPALPGEPPVPPSPYFMSPRGQGDPYNRYAPPAGTAGVLMIRTEKGIVVLNPGDVQRAEFTDREPAATIPVHVKTPAVRMQLVKPAGGKTVTVSCLVHGLTWVPGYMIDLSDPRKAKVSAHAEIMNELADFDNVSLQLVTGFPNIKFGDLLSPVAMSQSLSEFLAALSGGGGAQAGGGRGMMMNQIALNSSFSRMDEAVQPLVPGYSTAAAGTVAEDLFFYPIKNFTLKRGETAWLPLFTADMPYKHIYAWKIGDFLDENDHYRAEAQTPDRAGAEEVWHSCRLVNSLDMPLTTASAEFVVNGEFTGQDVCYYTAPGSETTIRINKALNVLAEQAEVEVERKRDASVIHGYHYDLVKLRGELKISSKIEKPINVEITKDLSGDVLESSPQSKDIKTARGLRQVNPRHVLTWTVALRPGEEQKVTYVYEVLFRE